jgi:hypothetical protein
MNCAGEPFSNICFCLASTSAGLLLVGPCYEHRKNRYRLFARTRLPVGRQGPHASWNPPKSELAQVWRWKDWWARPLEPWSDITGSANIVMRLRPST